MCSARPIISNSATLLLQNIIAADDLREADDIRRDRGLAEYGNFPGRQLTAKHIQTSADVAERIVNAVAKVLASPRQPAAIERVLTRRRENHRENQNSGKAGEQRSRKVTSGTSQVNIIPAQRHNSVPLGRSGLTAVTRPGRTTDQKVGGSNPSERAKVLVTGLQTSV